MLINANALSIPLAAKSVHTVVTSPPYYGLRDYGVDGQIGLEVTPDEYIANLVAVFRECKRILRDDGTLWVNIGDSYASNGEKQTGRNDGDRNGIDGFVGSTNYGDAGGKTKIKVETGLKPKDLIGIPWMLAFALRADGWYLRQDIIWHKPNPMPESVKDRCTKSHEYIFLLSKSARYYYDNEAVKEPANYPNDDRKARAKEEHKSMPDGLRNGLRPGNYDYDMTSRNKRDVWTVTTKPYKGAHYATFNPELIKPCILAGAPETCCAKCGAPYERVTERVSLGKRYSTGKSKEKNESGLVTGFSGYDDGSSSPVFKTIGFEPTCTCNAGTKAGIVFDPFVGSGTTVMVANHLGRKGIGLDLNFKYLKDNAKERIATVQPIMFN